MTIRFAAATKRYSPVMANCYSPLISLRAANDNGFAPAGEKMIHEALRHFARHGLRAAELARDNALLAQAANDSETFDWWVSICRTLDRRMAESLLDYSAAS